MEAETMSGIRVAGLGIPTGYIIIRLEKLPARLGMSGHKFRLPAVAGELLEKSITILREGGWFFTANIPAGTVFNRI
jgi:hypothetical protein